MSKKENNNFVSLLSDTTFKYLFKNPDTRPFLEKVIKLSTGIDISDYSLIDNELNSGNKLIKDYRVDILLKKDNNIISIEMNSSYYPTLEVRNRYYIYRVLGNLFSTGEKVKDFHVTQINFNNFFCKELKDLDIGIFSLREEKHDNLVIDDIKIYNIYLPNFKNMSYNNSSKLNYYLSMFTIDSFDKLRDICRDDKEGLIIVDELERLSQDELFGAYYDAEKERKWMENSIKYDIKQEGINQGIEQKAIETAKKMLSKNMPIDLISEITELSEEDIEKLKEEK